MNLPNCQKREINRLLENLEECHKDISNTLLSLNKIRKIKKIHSGPEILLLKNYTEYYHEILKNIIIEIRDWNYKNELK